MACPAGMHFDPIEQRCMPGVVASGMQAQAQAQAAQAIMTAGRIPTQTVMTAGRIPAEAGTQMTVTAPVSQAPVFDRFDRTLLSSVEKSFGAVPASVFELIRLAHAGTPAADLSRAIERHFKGQLKYLLRLWLKARTAAAAPPAAAPPAAAPPASDMAAIRRAMEQAAAERERQLRAEAEYRAKQWAAEQAAAQAAAQQAAAQQAAAQQAAAQQTAATPSAVPMPSAGTKMTLTPAAVDVAPPMPSALDILPVEEEKAPAKPFYKRPLFWFLLLGTAAAAGGVIYYVRRRRRRA